MLGFDADTPPPEHDAALAESKEMTARVGGLVRFAELEWIAVAGAGSWRRLLDTPVAA
jgi:hypothetical protein